jgi:hypothetical protein
VRPLVETESAIGVAGTRGYCYAPLAPFMVPSAPSGLLRVRWCLWQGGPSGRPCPAALLRAAVVIVSGT